MSKLSTARNFSEVPRKPDAHFPRAGWWRLCDNAEDHRQFCALPDWASESLWQLWRAFRPQAATHYRTTPALTQSRCEGAL